MAATWRLSSRMADILEGFYKHDLGDNEWFLLKIPTPQGLVEHEARFINSPMENYKPLGAGRWSYQANVEIKERQSISEELMVSQALYPLTVNAFTASVTNSMNKYLEN